MIVKLNMNIEIIIILKGTNIIFNENNRVGITLKKSLKNFDDIRLIYRKEIKDLRFFLYIKNFELNFDV